MDAWDSMMDYGDCDAFLECVKCFEVVCSPWSIFFKYVNDTWIIQHTTKKKCI